MIKAFLRLVGKMLCFFSIILLGGSLLLGKEECKHIGERLLDSVVLPEEVECMTEAVYFEARGESPEGRKAVMEVILNRTNNPTKFPNTVCKVIKQKNQFSYLLNPDLTIHEKQIYEQIKGEVHQHLLRVRLSDNYRVIDPCSDHYDGTASKAHWIKNMTNPQQIGKHIFYCTKTAA